MFVQHYLDRTRENKLPRKRFCFDAHTTCVLFDIRLLYYFFLSPIESFSFSSPHVNSNKQIRSCIYCEYIQNDVNCFRPMNVYRFAVSIETHYDNRCGSVEVAEVKRRSERRYIRR